MFSQFINEGVPLPVFWVFVGTVVLIQGISKSGFAGGAGILSMPLLFFVMPVNRAAAVMLPLLILCDMNAIYHHRHNKDWQTIFRIYLPAVFGILAGAAVWWWIGREGVERYGIWIKRFVGLIAIVFAIYIVCKEMALAWIDRFRPGVGAGIGAGVAAGFTSTIAHAAGPIVSLYIFAQDLGKTLFVGTVAWTFTLINLSKLPFYIGVGLIESDVLFFGAVLVPLIPVGSWLGKWMHHRVSETLFNRIILVLVFIAGIQLIFGFNPITWALTVFGGQV
ncbi:MAG: sulfite exporter TauE/SafE family protein [Candidatus Hydrogenedentota bacterium]